MSNSIQFIQENISVSTRGRATIEITHRLRELVNEANIETGLCHVFIHHTSASLIICENADIDVQTDLETFMSKLVRDGDPDFIHIAEGDDDMPAHIRSVLTQTELTIPIMESKLKLGTWQGVYLWEHRNIPHLRNITLSMYGH
ncbi:MAG: secondary thiamine-phosphate synthase enzyme YjbQ [Pseudomonadota bacterium]